MTTIIAGKRKNIPVELLRRSCRSHNTIDPGEILKKPVKVEHVKRIKSEPSLDAREVRKKLDIEIPKYSDIKVESQIKREILTKSFPESDGLIDVDTDELDLERTLLGGQSFRWTKEEESLVFTGIVRNHVFKLWRHSDSKIAYKLLNKESLDNSISSKYILEDYFQLKYNLKELYLEWSAKDEHLSKCCQQYKGFRILRQDPAENVFSFICATNNNIKRISLMIEKLCKKYGNILYTDDSEEQSIRPSYTAFPQIERLAEEDVFQCLRYELGFGYRAKFINATAKELVKLCKTKEIESPRVYLLSLRNLPYKETCKQLMTFPGIGRKVADCICLMSMDHLNSVPIDCHIYEIVHRHYMPDLRKERKTLTESVHDLIGKTFNDLHGPLAGWSTSVLFISELKHLKIGEGRKGKKIVKEKKVKLPTTKRE